MQEFFETFDETGEPLGLVARDVVHRTGLWHRASNVFLFRFDGRLVIQRRQRTKDVCPGTWDLSVAEHLQPGENFETAAKRGLMEELGLEVVNLELIANVTKAKLELGDLGIRDYEFQQCFRAISDCELRFRKAEVAELRLVWPDRLKKLMEESPSDFTPWFRSRAVDIGLFD